eukprot:CAMPEP_0183722068 /NCGR_PEP_ID=MMETSP0737-20130205/14140_1 /TAXON_ID=385413 /ORGANISM="Thalassiosira miniscula, Strain CCMP1093" /LENGTH=404 /DNA_ID=CAMNT_0025952167 /DNA_START=13 /DNA_END=1230 /DNA_ORIENTATION=+
MKIRKSKQRSSLNSSIRKIIVISVLLCFGISIYKNALLLRSLIDGGSSGGSSPPCSPQNEQPAAREFLPKTCHPHMVETFPTLTSLLEDGKDSSLGQTGGHWSACTHIQIYGFNFAAFFARHLAYGLQPKSVLEFGCGLGTTSDFLSRFVPGGSRVVCVEPEPMIGEVFGEGSTQRFPARPLQLAMLSFDDDAKSCSDRLFHPDMGFELVLSLEVAEHVPPEHTPELIRRLATATTKYLVFSAARPGQGGTGHIDESMHDRSWWIEQFTNADRGNGRGGLQYLPQLSRAIRYVTSYPERAYDFGTNLIAFGAPGVEDVDGIPQIAHDCFFHTKPYGETQHGDEEDKAYAAKHNLPQYLEMERPCEGASPEETQVRQKWLEGQAQALWPELDLLIRRVRSGDLQC